MTTASELHCRDGPPALVSEHRRQPPARLCAHCRADSQRVLALPHPLQPDRCGDEPPDRGQSSAGPVVTRRRSQDRRTRRAGDRAQQGGKRGAALPAHGAPVRPDRPTLERPEQAADDHLGSRATAARLQQLVAAINTNIGDLDRSTREILLLGDRRHKAIDKIEAANEAALRLLLQVTDDILSRIGASVDSRPQRPDRYAGPATRSGVAAHRLCRARRFQPRHHVAQRDRVRRNSRCPAGAAPATRDRRRQPVTEPGDPGIGCAPDSARVGELRAAGRSLVALGTADDGLLAIQTKLLPERQAVAAQQAALQTIGVDLREQVSKLNESAEPRQPAPRRSRPRRSTPAGCGSS